MHHLITSTKRPKMAFVESTFTYNPESTFSEIRIDCSYLGGGIVFLPKPMLIFVILAEKKSFQENLI